VNLCWSDDIDRKHSLRAPYHWHATTKQRGCLPTTTTTTPTTINLSDLFRPLLSDGPKAHVHFFHHAICHCHIYVGPANAVPNAVVYTIGSSSTKSGKLCARLVVLFVSIMHGCHAWRSHGNGQGTAGSQFQPVCPSSNSTCSKLVIGGNPRGGHFYTTAWCARDKELVNFACADDGASLSLWTLLLCVRVRSYWLRSIIYSIGLELVLWRFAV